jgi:hypothetical protein
MSTPSVTLRLGESRLFTMDFSALLARGETVASVNSVAKDLTTSPDLVMGVPAGGGVLAQVRLSGGLQDTRYKITMYVTTSGGNTVEGEGYLQCRGPLSFAITPPAGGMAAG